MSDLRNRYVLPVYAFVTIFVTNPGDLRNASRVERIERMIDDFEALPACNGPRFTRFWLRDYRAHLATEAEEFAEDTIQDPAPFSTEDIKAFIEWPEYHHWGGFMKFDNKTNRCCVLFAFRRFEIIIRYISFLHSYRFLNYPCNEIINSL